MTNNQDWNSTVKEMMSKFSFDTSGYDSAVGDAADVNEKFANVALEAAGKASELSAKWTSDTIARLSELSKARPSGADYQTLMAEFVKEQSEETANRMAAFGEVAKAVQIETAELMVTIGQDMSDKATSAANKATKQTASARKK